MKKSFSLAFLIAVIAVFSVFVSSPIKAEDALINLKCSNFFPQAHPNSILSEEWCKEIEKRTHGRVKISYFPDSAFVPPPQVYDAVESGIIDIGQSVLSYAANAADRFPLTAGIEYPFGYTNGLQATRLINAYYKKFKPGELNGTHILYLHAHGPGYFITKKEISNVDEIKGMKVLSTQPKAEIAKLMGAIPVIMPITDAHNALSMGVIDGVLLPVEPVKFWKLADVLKTTIRNYGCAFTHGFFIAMNKKKWESLPEDIQKIFDGVSEEWIDKQGTTWDNLDKEAEEEIVKNGHKILIATPQEQAATKEKMKPLFDNYIQKAKAKGFPGDEVVKFCVDYIATHP